MRHMKIVIETNKRVELVDITSSINSVIKKEGIKEGSCIIYVPHTTAGILINENYDPAVKHDILNWLNDKVPCNGGYLHSEGNADRSEERRVGKECRSRWSPDH